MSGVLYAAFLKFGIYLSPYLLVFSFLLPVLLYIPAFMLGVRGVLIAAFPIVTSFVGDGFSQIFSFILIVLIPCLLAGYFIVDQQKKSQKPIGIQELVENMSYCAIVIYSASLCIPETHILIEGFIAKLTVVIQQLSKMTNDKSSIEQLSYIFPLVFIFLNVSCARIALFCMRKMNPFLIPFYNDFKYRPWMDIPILFFMILQSLSDMLNLSVVFNFVVNGLLIISLWPALLLGIEVLKTIGKYYGFKEKTIKFLIAVLFFLVQPLIFIVLLGLMESGSSISRRFHNKQF
ncbi:MAG: hypothetical protein KBD31_02365 [Proteobacteria bacterium]|nr:hypothetical protein [Pseudomonadota bacterium]